MNILFVSHHKWPMIGGVEVHIREISKELKKKNYKITTISEEDIKPPKIKFFGLLYIWYWFLKNLNIFIKADIIHIHDVFIWILPIRFLFPFKKIYITFHGWEGKYPIPLWNVINKKIANYLTNGSIAVGSYIEKYYGVKSKYIIHGAVKKINKTKFKKNKNTLVWLGRTDLDTGYPEFQKWLLKNKQYKVTYVTNNPKPEKLLETSEYCVPSGYLSYLEAKNYGCKILTFPNNPLKVDYWSEIDSEKLVTWKDIAKFYFKLWIDLK